MTNWDKTFQSLPDIELDKLAVLRIVECTNGILQYMYRDSEPDALSIEETRQIMGFSMSSIKRMQIVLENETIEFADDTKEIMANVRDLYVKGMKHGDDDAYAEFLEASLGCMLACGIDRLTTAKQKLFDNCYAAPAYTWDYGLNYCKGFMTSSKS